MKFIIPFFLVFNLSVQSQSGESNGSESVWERMLNKIYDSSGALVDVFKKREDAKEKAQAERTQILKDFNTYGITSAVNPATHECINDSTTEESTFQDAFVKGSVPPPRKKTCANPEIGEEFYDSQSFATFNENRRICVFAGFTSCNNDPKIPIWNVGDIEYMADFIDVLNDCRKKRKVFMKKEVEDCKEYYVEGEKIYERHKEACEKCATNGGRLKIKAFNIVSKLCAYCTRLKEIKKEMKLGADFDMEMVRLGTGLVGEAIKKPPEEYVPIECDKSRCVIDGKMLTGDLLTLCLCYMYYSDGTPCMPDSECEKAKANMESCDAQVERIKAAGGCNGDTGMRCREMLAMCKCTELNKFPGMNKYWDSTKQMCLDVKGGGGPPGTPKYEGEEPELAGLEKTPEEEEEEATGTGSSFSAKLGSTGAGKGALAKRGKKEKDKRKKRYMDPLSTSGRGSFGYGTGMGFSTGVSVETKGKGLKGKRVKDIAKAKAKSVFELIKTIYKRGIKANKFMLVSAKGTKLERGSSRSGKRGKSKKSRGRKR